MLIAEDAGGHYLPVAPVSTIGEAREIAQHDLYRRLHEKERGEAVSPAVYEVWAHGLRGDVVAAEFAPSTL